MTPFQGFEVTERLSRVAPFGLRLWDAASARAVTDGLVVTLAPASRPDRLIAAFPNRSGVFIAQDLPGLREASFGEGDDDYWSSFATRHPFLVSVSDALGRFQPFVFTAGLPARGTVSLDAGSPLSPRGAGSVPLFSTAARPVPGGAAVVRAELRDTRTNGPASWAVVDVLSGGGRLGRGLADRDGRVSVVFAYPAPADPSPFAAPGSPLGGPSRRLSWPIRLSVFYAGWGGAAPAVPDLNLIFSRPAAALPDDPSPGGEPVLELGRELVVASPSRSVLRVEPAV